MDNGENQEIKELKKLMVWVGSLIIIGTLIFMYNVIPFRLGLNRGKSMLPALPERSISLNSYDAKYERYDIVNIYVGWEDNINKRIVGLPGETIQIKNDLVYINGTPLEDYIYGSGEWGWYGVAAEPIYIPEGYYFVIGDNWSDSKDSRIIGLISEEQIDSSIIKVWEF